MPRRAAVPLLLLLLAVPAGADTLLTVRSTVEGLRMDQPTKAEVHIWVAADKLRRDSGETSTIIRLDRGKVYVLNHGDRTYSEIAAPDVQKLAAAEGGAVKVVISPTSEAKKVGDWQARKYKVDITSQDGVHLDTTIWASREVASHQDYGKLAPVLAALQPGSAEWARQMQQIEGFPVLQEAEVAMAGSRFKTREELVAVETKEAPAGTYEPPAGYRALPAR